MPALFLPFSTSCCKAWAFQGHAVTVMNEAILLTPFHLTKIASSCSPLALDYNEKTALALSSIAVIVPFLLSFTIQLLLLSGPILNDIIISIQSFMLEWEDFNVKLNASSFILYIVIPAPGIYDDLQILICRYCTSMDLILGSDERQSLVDPSSARNRKEHGPSCIGGQKGFEDPTRSGRTFS